MLLCECNNFVTFCNRTLKLFKIYVINQGQLLLEEKGGKVMHRIAKKFVVAMLSAGMIVSGVGLSTEAGQTYDDSNVGITNKVEAYMASNSTDTNELIVGDVTETAEPEEGEVKEETPAEEKEETEASLTDAVEYEQFQDRAVITADTKVNIRAEESTEAEVIGAIERGGVCLVDEIGDEWTKIESGSCEGYISNEFLVYGDEAGKWCDENGIGRRATVNTATLKVRADMDENSDCLTLIPEGEDYYVCNINDGWTEIAVDDDIRGFVKSEYVDVTYDNPRAVSVEEQAEADRIAKEEADRAWLEYLAQQEALQQAQAAEAEQTVTEAPAATETQVAETQPVEQTTEAQPVAEETTVTETPAAEPVAETPVEEAPAPEPEPAPTAAPAGSTGVDLVNYAMQFVGNPYVWGGTSLTNGADCSGFVQSVYAAYGYSLPRVAASQAGCGVEVSLSDLQPGDLLFYSYDGSIGHVAIYAGGGTVVHASNSRDGIKTSSYNYRTPVKACRIIGQ